MAPNLSMLRVALAAICLSGAAHAQTLMATYVENSGTLPPMYAWHYSLGFAADGAVTTKYCKGYADDGPACAQRIDKLTAADLAKLTATLSAIAEEFAARPAAEMMQPPVGGGWVTAVITPPNSGAALTLPPFPIDADAARVTAALASLRAFTPKGAIEETMARAIAPK